MEAAFGNQSLDSATHGFLGNFQGFEFQPERMVILQSKEKKLLSLRQTHLFAAFFREHGQLCTLVEENWGKHEDVYRRAELEKLIVETKIF